MSLKGEGHDRWEVCCYKVWDILLYDDQKQFEFLVIITNHKKFMDFNYER